MGCSSSALGIQGSFIEQEGEHVCAHCARPLLDRDERLCCTCHGALWKEHRRSVRSSQCSSDMSRCSSIDSTRSGSGGSESNSDGLKELLEDALEYDHGSFVQSPRGDSPPKTRSNLQDSPCLRGESPATTRTRSSREDSPCLLISQARAHSPCKSSKATQQVHEEDDYSTGTPEVEPLYEDNFSTGTPEAQLHEVSLKPSHRWKVGFPSVEIMQKEW